MSEVKQATEANWENDVLNADLSSIVLFWAAWHGASKIMIPMLEDISRDYAGTLNVFTLDVESSHSIPPKYRINDIPTTAFVKNGNIVDTKVNSMSKSDMVEFIDKNR